MTRGLNNSHLFLARPEPKIVKMIPFALVHISTCLYVTSLEDLSRMLLNVGTLQIPAHYMNCRRFCSRKCLGHPPPPDRSDVTGSIPKYWRMFDNFYAMLIFTEFFILYIYTSQ
jgi:hypothetical protein